MALNSTCMPLDAAALFFGADSGALLMLALRGRVMNSRTVTCSGGFPDMAAFADATVRMLADDGAIIYLDGVEVKRVNMLNTADVCVNPDVANEMNDKSTMNKILE